MTQGIEFPPEIAHNGEEERGKGEPGSKVVGSKRNKAVYEWHLVLNHASQRALTRLAKDLHITDYGMEHIIEYRNMTCGPYMRTKMKQEPHRRTIHH